LFPYKNSKFCVKAIQALFDYRLDFLVHNKECQIRVTSCVVWMSPEQSEDARMTRKLSVVIPLFFEMIVGHLGVDSVTQIATL
jgi:hypothetical protein